MSIDEENRNEKNLKAAKELEIGNKEITDVQLLSYYSKIRQILNLSEACLNSKTDFSLFLVTLQIKLTKVFNHIYSL
jgi:hypothetical protein